MINLADAGRQFARRWFFQDQSTVDDLGVGIFRELGIDGFGRLQQGGFQCLGKGLGIGFNARYLAIFSQFTIQGFIVNQLFAIIVIALAMLDEKVA